MKAVWAEGLGEEMDLTLAFFLEFKEAVRGRITLTAASCYQLYADGQMKGFGPKRAAHGYARLSRHSFKAKTLVVLVESYNVKNFYRVKQPPFFAVEVRLADGRKFRSEDFACVRFSERVQKVPRYSYQRGFEAGKDAAPKPRLSRP